MGATKDVLKAFDEQQETIAACDRYYFGLNHNEMADFDSATTAPKKLPAPLLALYDALGTTDYAENIDKAVRVGVSAYQYRNGGDMPHASVIASALYAGVQYATNKEVPRDLIDTLAQYDTFTNEHYEQAAIVPAMTVVTIASYIANALPIVAMLPNPTGSVRIPIVSARFIADSNFGALRQGEYIDGTKAALPYAEGRFCYVMDNGGSGTTYSLVAHQMYKDFEAKTTDTSSPLLAFLSGNVSIRVNGVEIAHTRNNPDLSVLKGVISAVPKKGVELGGVTYKVVSSTIDIDNSSITVELNQALPAGAHLEAYLVADFDAKDANKQFKMTPVGVSLATEQDSIQAVPIINRVTVNVNANNQFANELGTGLVGSALAHMQGKVWLEQTARLIREAKDRAIYNGRVKQFDATRGVAGNLTSMVNTVGDLIGNMGYVMEYAKMQVRQATGSTAGYNVYVGDRGAVFFSQLSGDKFTRTGVYSGYNEIMRIGTLADGTNVYHIPDGQGVLNETPTTAEILLVGVGSEPLRNPFVGSMPMPPTIIEAKPDHREIQFGFHAQMAAELNPLGRYADQIVLIQMLNLPALG